MGEGHRDVLVNCRETRATARIERWHPRVTAGRGYGTARG